MDENPEGRGSKCYDGDGDGRGGGKKRKIAQTIDKFFKKKSELSSESVSTSQSQKSLPESSPVSLPYSINSIITQNTVVTAEPQPGSSHDAAIAASFQSFDNDIGTYINEIDRLNDYKKYELLTNPWIPPQNYTFPHCIVNKKGKPSRKFAQRSHLERFHWLVLSHKDQGLYCKYCALFVVSGGGQYRQNNLRNLVRTPLIKFDDLLGENGLLSSHEKKDYHVAAVEAGKNFIRSYKEPSLEICNQVLKQRHEQVKENRERLKPIIETILFLGRNNIPLRGHRDSGQLLLTEDSENIAIQAEEGIFRALLRFRVQSGDKVLENHIKTSSSKATYISPLTQNEIINCCAEEIQTKILDRVKNAIVYAIVFDETTDVSHIEQLSLSFRYVYNREIREDFITFANAYDAISEEDISSQGERRLTGKALAHIVLDILNKFSVDLSRCVGVGTDNCSVMSSDVLGAVQEITKSATNAKRCPCTNHLLNNSLAKTSTVAACRNATGTMKKVIAFATSSAKRHKLFKEKLGGTTLKGLCETRWAEKHDGHMQFREALPKIRSCLLEIQTWQDAKSSSDAFCLMQAISSTDFIVATVCLSDLLGVTISLSRKLQSPSLDLKCASELVNDTINVLNEKRSSADIVFKELFDEVQKICREMEVEVQTPRTLSRQTHRSNYPASTPEEYYLRSVFIPLMDNVIADIASRFPSDVLNCFGLNNLVPANLDRDTDLIAMAAPYSTLLEAPISALKYEYLMWVSKWERITASRSDIPKTALETIDQCDADIYPNINRLLHILATLPVSVATAERSFSTLKRLKTWLRNRMGQDRLTGLALLHTHKDIAITTENIIERFSKSKRKLDFIL